MRLEKLSLYNFKNYAEAQLTFQGNIQCFVGPNGSGKSNLLDAIHYLSFTRSAVNPSDPQNVKMGEDQFQIRGEFVRTRPFEVVCGYQAGQKKVIRVNGQECGKLSEHIGQFPVVLVAPNDIELIWDGSEMRRKFFDSLLSQVDQTYLQHLIVYAHHIKQRNGLLKIYSERGSMDSDMLEAYDQKLVQSGTYIYQKRKEFMLEFLPYFEKDYSFLIGAAGEKPRIQYRSQLEEADFAALLKSHWKRDIILQRTGSGVHRDDFLFTLNGNELKRFGSQGQQKSFLISLKLAEFRVVAQKKGHKPLLLLDDIFDKLDDQRIHQLMVLVANGTFGQLFITDARVGRCREILAETGVRAQLFEVVEGRVKALTA